MIFFNEKNKSIKIVSGVLALIYTLIPFFIETHPNLNEKDYFPSKAVYYLFEILYTGTIAPFLAILIYILFIWLALYLVMVALKSIIIIIKK
jgi:hypothetical protein